MSDEFGPVVHPAPARDDSIDVFGPRIAPHFVHEAPRVRTVLHFDPVTGAIIGWETGPHPKPLDGFAMVEHRHDCHPGHDFMKAHKIAGGIAVPRSAAEVAATERPTMHHLKTLIFSELQASDKTQIADLPLDPGLRAQWVSYRTILRGLSKLGSVGAMLAAWPIRPDGIDAAADLRAAHQKSTEIAG